MWGISYWIFPVISALGWLGTLLGLLISWNVEGRPHYASMDANQSIAYISDVGAQHLKPVFIAGAVITTVFLDLSFASERWLRHCGRLAKNTSYGEKVLATLSIIFAIVGTVGLICLSIRDTLRHHDEHDIFLVLFIGGYIISAIFICWEYQRLGIKFREHRVLRASFWLKLAFILLEFVLAVAFATLSYLKHFNSAAVLEWAISFIFTFYALSFFIDLLPATCMKQSHTNFGTGPGGTQMQMEESDAYSQAAQGHTHGYHGRATADSERTLGTNDMRTVNGVKYEGGQAPVASNF